MHAWHLVYYNFYALYTDGQIAGFIFSSQKPIINTFLHYTDRKAEADVHAVADNGRYPPDLVGYSRTISYLKKQVFQDTSSVVVSCQII